MVFLALVIRLIADLAEALTAFIIGNIYALYMFLFIALHAAAIAFAVERFFRFKRLISWLIASIVFLWLMELFVVKGFPWLLLIPSVVWLLLVILFISALVYLAQRTNSEKG